MLIAFDSQSILTVHTDGSRLHPLTAPGTGTFDEFPHYGRVPLG